MKFQVSSELAYKVQFPSTLLLNIHALRTPMQTVLEEAFQIEPYIRTEELVSANNENRFVRLETGDAKEIKITYKALVDTHYTIIDAHKLEGVPVISLDSSILPFLFPSRYCQSDKLSRLAYDKFGNIGNAFAKVEAIAEWIYRNVEYLSGSTNSQTSAYDTVTQRTGVCRDFAHLGIALCRALSIPARYFTGYAYQLKPADFHACFEAFIGGQWLIFDATKLAPLNGLVKIGTGRDAADAAVASIFGSVSSTGISVSCQLADNEAFTPFTTDESNKGLSFDPVLLQKPSAIASVNGQ
jgi:transglutaminase-like putative cysteine protease